MKRVAAAQVFFDPELAGGMASGTISRRQIDRFCIVLMAGIAAEAMCNGKAEGGQQDEAGLVSFLAALDGGKGWDLARIQNQARWASSQALLLLREHKAAFDGVSKALESGGGVGAAVRAIEDGIDEGFGDGMPPGLARLEAAAAAAAAAAPQQVPDGAAEARATAAQSAADVEAREAAVAARLKEIEGKLAEL